MSTHSFILPTACLTLLLAGCAEPPTPARASLDAPSFITAAGDTVPMREALRIGRLDGPDEYTFSGLLWTLPTPDGGVILYDLGSSNGTGNDGRIRHYDPDGLFVRYIGRRGEGPGEHSGFPEATLLRDGSVLLADQSLARFTRFNALGNLVGTWPGPSGIVGLQSASNGGWYTSIVTDHPQDMPRRIEYVHYDSLGNEVARFPAPDAYHDGPWARAGAVDVAMSAVAILPDGRMATTRGDSLVVVIHGTGPAVRVDAAHQSVPYLPDEAEALRRMIASRYQGARVPSSQLEVPEFKPASSGMRTDRGGRILVKVRTSGFLDDAANLQANQSPWRETLAVEVFDSSGTHRGRLVAPRPTLGYGASFSDDAVWLVEEGESGELYLVKWVPESVVW
jgi:hypothetical protein